ncbi:MAG: hypothetical protein ACFFAN_09590 [Promethearchaeota archaeon]
MNIKNKREKKSIIVLIILISQIFVVSLVSIWSISAVGWNNNTGRYEYNEDSVRWYCFEKNYGTHDWIADSAVRLILLDDNYKYKIRWLFDEDKEVPFDQLDNYRLKWWDRSYTNVPVFTDTSSHTKRQQWFYARRYGRYLSATFWPDFGHTINIAKNCPIPAERVPVRTPTWATKTQRFYGHSVEFLWDDNNQEWVLHKNKAGSYALSAAYDAIKYLNYEGELKDGTKKRCRKYEAAAICVGAMTHYIGDVAHPSHVKTWLVPPVSMYDENRVSISPQWHLSFPKSKNDDYIKSTTSGHWGWDIRTTESRNTKFDTNLFKNGGPYWELTDSLYGPDPRRVVFDDEGQSYLTPLSPNDACKLLAELAYSGYDVDGTYDENPSNKNKWKLGPHSAFELPSATEDPLKEEIDNNAAYRWPDSFAINADDDYSLKWWNTTWGWKPDVPPPIEGCARQYKPLQEPYPADRQTPSPINWKTEYEAAKDESYKRLWKMLEWAAYYTACALLWVCEKARIEKNEVHDDEDDRFDDWKYPGGGKREGFVPFSDVKKYLQGEKIENEQSRDFFRNIGVSVDVLNGFTITIVLMAPALVGASAQIVESARQHKKDLNQDPLPPEEIPITDIIET